MKATIYRVQCWRGRGPYAPGLSHLWAAPDHSLRNPDTLTEFGLRRLRAYPASTNAGTGFATLDGLRQWFTPGERKVLGILGYRVARLDDATIYAIGAVQLLFWRRARHHDCAWIPWKAIEDGDASAAASPGRMDAPAAHPDRRD